MSHVRSVDDVRSVDSRLGDFATLIHEMKKAHTVLATKPADRRTAGELTMAVANMMATLAQVESAATIGLSSHGTNGS